jgi:transcription elongation factor GreB
MSRGFVREGDQEEPVVIPQRAVLPDNVINYVTVNGMRELRKELERLENDFAGVSVEDEKERRREQTLALGKIKLLQERMNAARLIHLEDQPKDEIRFGATVSFKNLSLKTNQVLTITGVDEANVAMQKIAFTTPIVRAITGAKVGDVIHFKLGTNKSILSIEAIDYRNLV